MRAAQIVQPPRIPASIRSPYFQPNLSKRNRDKGPKVIAPIPVPAVTIPVREDTQEKIAPRYQEFSFTGSDSTFFLEVIANHHNTGEINKTHRNATNKTKE